MGSNKFAGPCTSCGQQVPAQGGDLIRTAHGFGVRCISCRPAPPVPGDHGGWHHGKLVGLDCESTGVNPKIDRIVQFALVAGSEESYQWLINPGIPVPPAATEIHGLSTEFLEENGLAPEIAFREISQTITRLHQSETSFVVFNAPYDLPILRAELQRNMVPVPNFAGLHVIDPMILLWGLHDRQLMRQSVACARYSIDPGTAHQALDDARAVLALAQAVGSCHPELAQLSATELMTTQREWWQEKATDWNNYASRAGRSLDDPAGWPLPED